jgi:hypothetical protein
VSLVTKPRPIAWIAPFAAVALAFALGVTACAPAKPPTTSLRLAPAEGAPRNAKVVIDDQELGPLWYVTQHGVAMPPGKHRITIEAEGYLPWDQEVDAGPDGGLMKLDVKLIKRPE